MVTQYYKQPCHENEISDLAELEQMELAALHSSLDILGTNSSSSATQLFQRCACEVEHLHTANMSCTCMHVSVYLRVPFHVRPAQPMHDHDVL